MQSNQSTRLSGSATTLIVSATIVITTAFGCSPMQLADIDDFIDQYPQPQRVEATTLDNANFDDTEFDVDPSIASDLPKTFPSRNKLEPMEVPSSFDGYEDRRNGYQQSNSVTVDPNVFKRSPAKTPTQSLTSGNGMLSPSEWQPNRLQPTTRPATQPATQSSRPMPIVATRPLPVSGADQQAGKQPVILVANPDAFAKAQARLDAEKAASQTPQKEFEAQTIASEEIEMRPLPDSTPEMHLTSKPEPNPLLPSQPIPSAPIVDSVAIERPEPTMETCTDPNCKIHGVQSDESFTNDEIAKVEPAKQIDEPVTDESNDFAPAVANEQKEIVVSSDESLEIIDGFDFDPAALAEAMMAEAQPDNFPNASKIAVEETEDDPQTRLASATVTLPTLPPPVLAVPPSPPQPITWDKQLASTISALESQINELTDETQKTDLNSGLTILQTLQFKMSEDKPLFESAGSREYWDYQVDALSELLNKSVTRKDSTGPASRAVQHLQQAVTQLREIANLKVSVVKFCTKVAGYGQYVPEVTGQFSVGQQTLIYCELENFIPAIETIDNQTIYRTRLKSRFHVVNSGGDIVQQVEFPVVEDVARNRRRDFYMHLPVTIGELGPGSYQLYLTIEDLSGNKTATMDSPLRFDLALIHI